MSDGVRPVWVVAQGYHGGLDVDKEVNPCQLVLCQQQTHEQFSLSLYYVLIIDFGEPEYYEEAMQVENRKKWEQGINKEMDSLVINHTWYLVDFPIDKRALQNKWVFKLKEEGGKKQYKDRLVVKGFAQNKCIDFD